MPIEMKMPLTLGLIGLLISFGGLITVGNNRLQELCKSLLYLDIVILILYLVYVLRR